LNASTFPQKGTLCIWAADSRGSLTALRQYKKKGEITCLAFCTTVMKSDPLFVSKKKTDAKIVPPTSFFYATDKGWILHADDLGHCADVQQLNSSIDHMLFFEERSRLVVMTRSMLLTQYAISEEGKVSRASQIKISISGDAVDKGIRSLLWAGPGLLAAIAGQFSLPSLSLSHSLTLLTLLTLHAEDQFIRFFDLAADENYNISLKASLGGFVDRSDRLSTMAFNPVDRSLSVGTNMGIVAVWRFNGAMRDLKNTVGVAAATAANDWEVCDCSAVLVAACSVDSLLFTLFVCLFVCLHS
jgi:WD40 repeat protein